MFGNIGISIMQKRFNQKEIINQGLEQRQIKSIQKALLHFCVDKTFIKTQMSFIDSQKLETLVKEVDNLQKLQSFFEETRKKDKNDLKSSAKQSLDVILSSCKVINSSLRVGWKEIKSSSESHSYKRQPFNRKEIHVFKWALDVYSMKHSLSLDQLGQNHFQELQDIFCGKQLLCIKYEIFRLVPSRPKMVKEWTETEEQCLSALVQKNDKLEKGVDNPITKNFHKDWSEISYELFQLSESKFFRTPTQCKQRWLNYLNKDIRHDEWSKKETIKLLQGVESFGQKWADLFEYFNGTRTEHMIKNRYKTIMKSVEKKYNLKDNIPKNWIARFLSSEKSSKGRKDKRGQKGKNPKQSSSSGNSSDVQNQTESQVQKVANEIRSESQCQDLFQIKEEVKQFKKEGLQYNKLISLCVQNVLEVDDKRVKASNEESSHFQLLSMSKFHHLFGDSSDECGIKI